MTSLEPQLPAYKIPSLPIQERVRDLLARMTRTEKISQLVQIFVTPHNRGEVEARIRERGLGSRILATSQLAGSAKEGALELEDLNTLQRVAVEESRLGIPLIYGRDVVHGHRTVFPVPLALAATWDPGLVQESYQVAAREAASAGVHWVFAPMLDIARDPRWGRIVEGYGEDPYLTGQMASAAVRGYQGDDLANGEQVLACPKHYLGYGAAEGGRDYNTLEISDITLRNIYLPPFQAAIDAGAGSLMAGFPDLNGEPLTASRYLLTDLLRGECGFDGFVVSDWAAVQEIVQHRVAADEKDAARRAINAGIDMEMVSGCFDASLETLIEQGEVCEERLDEAVGRVLAAKFRLGLFEHPYTDPKLAEQVQFSPPHRDLARRAAGRSLVLLKNNGMLPLAPDLGLIAVIGPLVRQRHALLGSWTLDGLLEDTQTLLDAVREACPDTKIAETSDALTDEMLIEAARSDVVILAVGESNLRNGEYNNTASLNLPAGQEALIEAVCGLGKPVVLVVFAGRPLNLTRSVQVADAVLWAWHPGSLGAAAVADALFGKVNPGGKLPVTFPRSEGQVPFHYNHNSTGRPAMSRYLDIPARPLYPFGYGLSYTTFEIQDLALDADEIPADGSVSVSVTVSNTGAQAGEEVVQLYVQDCVSSITRPVKELKGFARVPLQAGESRRVRFSLGPAELSFCGKDGKRRVEPGEFIVWVGSDSNASLSKTFRVV